MMMTSPYITTHYFSQLRASTEWRRRGGGATLTQPHSARLGSARLGGSQQAAQPWPGRSLPGAPRRVFARAPSSVICRHSARTQESSRVEEWRPRATPRHHTSYPIQPGYLRCNVLCCSSSVFQEALTLDRTSHNAHKGPLGVGALGAGACASHCTEHALLFCIRGGRGASLATATGNELSILHARESFSANRVQGWC